MGIIYIIKNKINDKVYIGQTNHTLEDRWKYHKKASKDKNKTKYKIYKAINKYGIDNFYCEVVEENISSEILDDKEVFYIKLYDSFNNGYNSTPGGKGGLIVNSIDDIKYIVDEYNKGRSSEDIALEYGVCGTTICRVLKREGVTTRDSGRKLDLSLLDEIIEKSQYYTYEQLGKMYGVNRRTIGRFLNKNGIKQRNRK